MTPLPFFSALDRALFPSLCAVCDRLLSCGERVLCTSCRRQLPYFDNRSLTHNKVTAIRRKTLPIAYGASLLSFQKGGPVQRLIHQLKYHKRAEISSVLGLWLGAQLQDTELVHYHYTLPVPLHPKKRKKRGYNQVSGFARALASQLGLRAREDLLFRVCDDEPQTKQSRLARQRNVKKAFKVFDYEALRGKRVLLVDDVMTTGATLSACARELLHAPEARVSLAVMAVAG